MTADRSRESARIDVQPNGPYLVHGHPLVRRRPVTSSEGEPLTWQTTQQVETREVYALCRCGNSANKPFCDGSHVTTGFDGTETAPTNDYADRANTMEGVDLVVTDDRSICEHAGFCGNRSSNVWELMGGSATSEGVTRAGVMAMVERCPSGALTYRTKADSADIENDLRAEVGVVDDGPLFVTGGVQVNRSDGERFETRNRMTLCRCGQSKIKPLCDGSHKEAGFRDSAP